MTNILKQSWNGIQSFWKEEDGIGTLEMVLIIAVILIIALAFKSKITAVVTGMLDYMGQKSEEFKK
ncbi:Flp1 family type IVb pilin [Paenibacillus wulumuqiensis]|uniref:Flp1 family type IVb pilin n=1 Tax=Paenibacillus wulumuqiensis TaxID=1567107 RepID=UPI000695B14E|nr:Flp1 family type IVb pilin [Paenibacillus wulumuqiensis]